MDTYIDMHCHLLPGVDDGARDMEETRRMLKMAYDEGVRYIIATPHHHPRRGKPSTREIARQLQAVREAAHQTGDGMKVFPGTEIYFGQDIPDKLKAGDVLTMNRTEYVLVEFSPSDPFEYMQQGIQRIQMKGYIVILAHAERYDCLREDIGTAEYFQEMGVLIQVNAGSITLVFCVGTDAHDDGKRAPRMRRAAEYVAKKYGEEYARRIFFGNAADMLRKKKKNEPR